MQRGQQQNQQYGLRGQSKAATALWICRFQNNPPRSESAVAALLCRRSPYREWPHLHRQRFEQLIHLAVAIGEFVQVHADLVEQSQVEIGQWCRLREFNLAPAFHASRRSTGDKDRQVTVVVHVGIAYAAAVKVKRMVEQGAVAFGRGFQFLQELRKKGNMEVIDLRHTRDLFWIIAVM